MYKLIIAAWLAGSQLTFMSPENILFVEPSDFKTGCPVKDSEPTVFYWKDDSCRSILRAVSDAQVIHIDKDGNGDPEYVFKYVNGKGWTRVK